MDHVKTGHVLIVEDDPQIRAALEELMTTEGYDVSVASNGAEAIELLEEGERPRAVLVDLLMRGEAAAVGLDDALADVEPEAGALLLVTLRGPVRVEDVGQVGGGDAWSGV